MNRWPHFVGALSLVLVAGPAAGDAGQMDARLRDYLENGGVVVIHQGEVLHEFRGREKFIPASTLKVATALAAIHYLGSGYRFRTEVYLSGAGDVAIRGYGDPFLVSEEWELVLDAVTALDSFPKTIRDLYLDVTAFDEIDVPGLASTLDPYNARNGALAANFNTIHVRVDRDGTVRPAEPQTPLTPLGRRWAEGLSAGRHRINITRDPDAAVSYVGELVRELLGKRGHEVAGRIAIRSLTPELELVYTHENSRTLEEVVAAMMLYSNNFIANQLLLTVGLEEAGEPTSLAKSVRCLDRFLTEEIGLDRAEFEVVEGSGISRRNRFTPLALAKVVQAFYPYRGLLARHRGVSLKTGTLTGVYSLAGYLPSDHPMPFVILLNQPRNTRDQVLSVLEAAVESVFEPRVEGSERASGLL